MKKVTLRRTKMPVNYLDKSNSDTVDYVWIDEVRRILLTPKNPQAGTNMEEMLEVMPILAKLKAVKMPEIGDTTIDLENAEHKLIVERLKGAQYTVNAPEIFDMIQTISEAENA